MFALFSTLTFIDIDAGFPIILELESLRTKAEDLVVAVHALMRAAAVVFAAAVRVVASVAVRGQGGA